MSEKGFLLWEKLMTSLCITWHFTDSVCVEPGKVGTGGHAFYRSYTSQLSPTGHHECTSLMVCWNINPVILTTFDPCYVVYVSSKDPGGWDEAHPPRWAPSCACTPRSRDLRRAHPLHSVYPGLNPCYTAGHQSPPSLTVVTQCTNFSACYCNGLLPHPS